MAMAELCPDRASPRKRIDSEGPGMAPGTMWCLAPCDAPAVRMEPVAPPLERVIREAQKRVGKPAGEPPERRRVRSSVPSQYRTRQFGQVSVL